MNRAGQEQTAQKVAVADLPDHLPVVQAGLRRGLVAAPGRAVVVEHVLMHGVHAFTLRRTPQPRPAD